MSDKVPVNLGVVDDAHMASEVVEEDEHSVEEINPDEIEIISVDHPVFIDDDFAEVPIASNESSSKDLVSYDPLEQYFAEIRDIPRLTQEEEKSLVIRFREHADKKAGYKLVMANLRLVVMIAKEYKRAISNLLDLVQEGNLGLMEAVDKFDLTYGVRFSSYAAYWIRAYMLRYLMNNVRLVKIGTTQAQRKLFFNLQKEEDKLQALGFYPDSHVIADRLGVKVQEVIEMEQRLALPDLSVDAPLGTDDDSSATYSDFLAGPDSTDGKAEVEDFSSKIRDAVNRFSASLSDREKKILYRRLFTEEPITLQEIADEAGISRERVRQIESRLKEKLAPYLSSELGIEAEDIQIGKR